jgi:hypothetical protein
MMDTSILKASHARPSPTLFLTTHVAGRSLTLEGTAAGSLSIWSSQLLLFGTSTFLLQQTFCFCTIGLQTMHVRKTVELAVGAGYHYGYHHYYMIWIENLELLAASQHQLIEYHKIAVNKFDVQQLSSLMTCSSTVMETQQA